jgi:hypothetical protein
MKTKGWAPTILVISLCQITVIQVYRLTEAETSTNLLREVASIVTKNNVGARTATVGSVSMEANFSSENSTKLLVNHSKLKEEVVIRAAATITPSPPPRRVVDLSRIKWNLPKKFENQTLHPHITDPALPDFPYNLSCPGTQSASSLSKKNVSVTLVYNVGMVGNWEDIVRDQMTTVALCGLAPLVDVFIVTFSYGSTASDRSTSSFKEALLSLFRQLPFSSEHPPDTLEHVQTQPWEGVAMNLTLDHCRERERTRYAALAKQRENTESSHFHDQARPTVVFYMHTKGSSHYTRDWKHELVHYGSSVSTTYGQTLYWRKYMEYFTIERPHLCLSRLLVTIPTEDPLHQKREESISYPPESGVACGVEYHWQYHMYSGNFWSATCDYISRTRAPLTNAKYTAAEFFIGGQPAQSGDPFVTLAQYQGISLYRHLILPEHYRFTKEQEDSTYAGISFPILVPDKRY